MRTPLLILITLLLCCALSSRGQDVTAARNLLINPGFEAGGDAPVGWRAFSRQPQGIDYVWDDAKSHSGKRSAGVVGAGDGFGVWQQIVDVEPGQVYVFTAYLSFEGIAPPGRCSLQLVFRGSDNEMIQMVHFPSHTGTREFAFDFPPKLKVRAPEEAARVEVNLFLRGKGKAWFDDVFFGPAPTGDIAGAVTSKGEPVEGARVYIWGDPWGKTCEAFTDPAGNYRLTGIPVAFPRYILLAGKKGYMTRPAGDVEVKAGAVTAVDFELAPGSDPDDLRIKFGSLSSQKSVRGPRIPKGAAIPADASGYPEAVRPYLEPDDYIQSDNPAVIAKAKELAGTLPAADRKDTRKVAWAIFEWVSKNIDHDGVFSIAARGGLDQPFRDVTSGIWQTLASNGWCWGKSFLDWGYSPDGLLEVSAGICVEHSWLVAAMFRSLNVPARTSVGSYEFYAQSSEENGVWVHGSTTSGRTGYRERGALDRGFEGDRPEPRFSVLSRPVLHEDWNAQNKGLWRERHPWRERYDGTPEGYQKALTDLATFSETGEAPRGTPRPSPAARAGARDQQARTAQQQEDLATQRRPPRKRPSDLHVIHYSDVTINLLNMGAQRTLDVRFPMVSLTDTGAEIKAHTVYWTNHPECVKHTWVEKITNPPAKGAERWYHVEFDLGSLMAPGDG